MNRILLLGSLLAAGTSLAAASAPPNIVFIIADDLGWADVAFHGGNAPTPNLDQLAREGVELTQHYVAATCTPTRVGLLTGRYWSRFGIYGPSNSRALPWDTVTLPRALKQAGYDTALTGKWHLGSKSEWGPNRFGFDHSYGSLAGGVGPYDHFYKRGGYMRTWHRNGQLVTEEGHVTALIADEAVKWIAGRGNAPFFLYVPFTAVHLPLKEPEEWVARVPATITEEVARQYAACIMHMDDAVGRIVAALGKAGKRDNTIVVFTSDNGGSWAVNNGQDYPDDGYVGGKIPGNNTPLRGQKGQLYEGGIRVPTIVSWPGRLRPAKVDQPVHIVDWMPTFTALAGFRPASDVKWDGVNIWPKISGQSRSREARLLYWTTPRGAAVREGDMKLIVAAQGDGATGKAELFDLAKDPSETTDLAARNPRQVEALKERLAVVAKADRDAMAKD
jgi:arylsulfatase A-like enzyme